MSEHKSYSEGREGFKKCFLGVLDHEGCLLTLLFYRPTHTDKYIYVNNHIIA